MVFHSNSSNDQWKTVSSRLAAGVIRRNYTKPSSRVRLHLPIIRGIKIRQCNESYIISLVRLENQRTVILLQIVYLTWRSHSLLPADRPRCIVLVNGNGWAEGICQTHLSSSLLIDPYLFLFWDDSCSPRSAANGFPLPVRYIYSGICVWTPGRLMSVYQFSTSLQSNSIFTSVIEWIKPREDFIISVFRVLYLGCFSSRLTVSLFLNR